MSELFEVRLCTKSGRDKPLMLSLWAVVPAQEELEFYAGVLVGSALSRATFSMFGKITTSTSRASEICLKPTYHTTNVATIADMIAL